MFWLDTSLVPDKLSNFQRANEFKVSYKGLVTAIPFVVFAFLFHPNVPMVYRELKIQSYSQMRKVIITGLSFSVILYILVCTFGYL
mmetsp:Transcript_29827/g.26381  ORF Transcript_29827/g.26381 Transcript_29827/m.26381 type:complete len:86 (+) Transcript_29827:225-482(+)